MASYRIEDRVLNTKKAKESWEEDRRFNGNNFISKATGSQWDHEQLHLSSKGTYFLEQWSDWQGTTPSAEILSYKEAALWLSSQGYDLPEELEQYDPEE